MEALRRRGDPARPEGPKYRLKLLGSALVLGGVAFLVTTVFGVASAPAVSNVAHRRRAVVAVSELGAAAQRVGAMVPTDAPVILAARDGGSLNLYSTPGALAPAATLPPQDELGSPSVLLAVQRSGDWYRALLPTRPNGSTAWVRAEDVTTTAPAYEVNVSLEAHQLQLVQLSDDAVVLSSPVGIGAPSTPTPTGEFFVRDLDRTSGAAATAAYGPFAFGLSGHSDVYLHFGTGDGRIAIHGTSDPASVGADESNGCVHVLNDFDLELTNYLTFGDPVFIS